MHRSYRLIDLLEQVLAHLLMHFFGIAFAFYPMIQAAYAASRILVVIDVDVLKARMTLFRRRGITGEKNIFQ